MAMQRPQLKIQTWHWLLLAGLGLGAWPASAHGAWLGYRNDTKTPVIVQSHSIVNRMIRQGRPHLLYSGEVAWDPIIQAGQKIITVYDAKTRAVLFQTTVTVTADLFLSAQPDGPGKAKLVPAKMPKNKPPG
jgi:hypothetical protein